MTGIPARADAALSRPGLTIATAPTDLAAGRRALVSGGVPLHFQPSGAAVPSNGAPILRATVPSALAGRTTPLTQLFMKRGTQRAVRARIPNLPAHGSAAWHADPRGMHDVHTLHWASPILPCNGSHPTEWGNQPCPLEDARGFVYSAGDINASWYDLAHVELVPPGPSPRPSQLCAAASPSNSSLLLPPS